MTAMATIVVGIIVVVAITVVLIVVPPVTRHSFVYPFGHFHHFPQEFSLDLLCHTTRFEG
jgi:hypothetical protein